MNIPEKGNTSALGHRLRLARMSASVTQSHMAKQLDVSQATIARMEAGKGMISAFHLFAWQFVTGIEIPPVLSEDTDFQCPCPFCPTRKGKKR